MSEITLAPPTVEEAAFLEAIAYSESKGQYNIRWDGPNSSAKTFDSYDQHPQVKKPALEPGTTSDAAGRYQFLSKTYHDLRDKYPELELNDFSPEAQDRAALFYARLAYKQQADIHGEKRSFAEALKSDPSLAFSYLGETWTSAKGGTEQNKATDAGYKLYESIINGDASIKSASAKNGIWDLGSAAWDDKKRASFKRNVLNYEKSRKELESRKDSMTEEEYAEEQAVLYSTYNDVLQNGYEAKKVIEEESAKSNDNKNISLSEKEKKLKEAYAKHQKLVEEKKVLDELGSNASPESVFKFSAKFDQSKKTLENRHKDFVDARLKFLKSQSENVSNLTVEQARQINEEIDNLSVFPRVKTTNEEALAKEQRVFKDPDISQKVGDYLNYREEKKSKNQDLENPDEQSRASEFNRIILMDQQRVIDAGGAGGRGGGSGSQSGQAGNEQKSGDPSDTDKGNLGIDGTEGGSIEQTEGLGLETMLDQPFVYNPERQSFFESVGGAPAVLGLGMALTAAGEGDQDPGDVEIPRVSEMVINHANTLRDISKRGLNPVEEARLRNDISTAFQTAVKAVQEISGGQMGAALAGVSSANVARNEQLKNKAIIDLDVKRKALADYGQLLTNLDSRNQDAGAREAELNYNMQYNRAVAQGKAIASGVNAMINAQQYAEETGPNSMHDIQRQYMLSKFASLDKDLEIVKEATNVGVDATNQQSTEPQKDDKDPLTLGSMATNIELPSNQPEYFSKAIPAERKQVNFGEMMIKAPEAKLKL